MTQLPSDEEFRACGKTGAAREFPLSEAGCVWIAAFNGIQREKMPRAWCFASNAYMRAFIEARAA